VYDAIFAESMNKPTVVLVNQNFFTDFKSASSSRGIPIRGVSETVPPECTLEDKIRAGVDSAMEDIIAALTNPLTEEEKSPKPRELEKIQRLVFKGTFNEVNSFFYQRGWTDGLPIIPPTEEDLKEMLTGTDLAPDHIVAKIIPRLGKATIEKIAINAVMAGALPTYMPVLIAGVQALIEPNTRFGTTGVSTGSWIPFWIINGPIRRDIHINYGSGTLSPGNIANATIGRAMGLIIKNIGGIRKGIEDMGIYGNPGKYSMVSGENEEESPWEPLHVEHGFKKEESAITLCFPRSMTQAPTFGSDASSILRSIISTLTTKAGALTIMMNVQHAQAFAEDNWTKKEIAQFIFKYAQQPAYRTQDFWGQWGPERIRQPLNQTDPVPVLNSPESVRLLVAGGAGALFTKLLTGSIGWETKKIKLPANWDKLVAKYKGMVPTYYKY
jgi:hypothetical protein